jgi:hypothetical protein
MQERLLQFIWKEKYFNTADLVTESGEKLVIQDAGTFNPHQGPDFLDARIRLGDTTWAGNIELHIKSSEWNRHRHNDDPNYRNVILHVVWEDDERRLSEIIPTLVLAPRVSSIMLDRYKLLMDQRNVIACEGNIGEVPEGIWSAWKEELLGARLKRKSKLILQLLKESGSNWEECSWWWLARNFGGTVNAQFFEQVARSVPVKSLARHRNQVIQLEAILLGQANFLKPSNADPYVQLLQREYRHLQHKYGLVPVHGQAQMLRMRPAGFPTVRLAQLAMLLHKLPSLHHLLVEVETIREMEQMLEITANDFWHYHYTLGEAAPYQPKHLGSDMRTYLIINGIIPLVYTLGERLDHSGMKQKAARWMHSLPPERNSLVRSWERIGQVSDSAAGTQALTELKKNYCGVKRCLDCRLGHHLLNR